MKKLLLSLLLIFPLAAQVTAVKNTSTTVTAAAGTLSCVFTSGTPIPAGGVQVTITDASATLKETFNQIIPAASGGVTGQINTAAGAVTWILTLPIAGGPINYNITATPTGGTSATGSGTF